MLCQINYYHTIPYHIILSIYTYRECIILLGMWKCFEKNTLELTIDISKTKLKEMAIYMYNRFYQQNDFLYISIHSNIF